VLTMRRFRRQHDERGAAAILFALLASLLLVVGALAVDLGHAYATRSLLQTDVDLAVMAAAAELDNGGACNPEVVAKATEYLSKSDNEVPGQYAINLGGTPGDNDGYIDCKDWKVTLWAPRSHVDYGLGSIVDQNGADISAHAVAQIKAAKAQATLPFFAVQGCDYGQQSIRNASGPATGVPPLTPATGSPANSASFTINPSSVASATTSANITLTGNGFNNASKVYFSNASGANYIATIPAPTPTNATTSFTVGVPSAVLALDDTWYVRVLIGTKLSKEADAQPFTVGPPKLYCDASNQGNFGTIDLPRTDTNSFSLQWNMIKGIEPTLAKVSGKSGQCSGQPGAVESKTSPVNGTNCLATEPGLKIAETNEGLITGKGGLKGRLDADSTGSCSRNHDSSRTAATIKSIHVNDDLLTCFITNGASIQNLVNGDSVATQALSSDIYNSPRFFWIPVLTPDPSTGKKSWWIIDFRPGFITDQSVGATHNAPGTISSLNGLVADSQGISELKVILFSEKALPEFAPTTGGEADYTGSGPKALVLVQ